MSFIKRIFIDGNRHDSLPLPSGELAISLRISPLRNELLRLGIAVTPTMSKFEMLDVYAAKVAEVVEDLSRTANPDLALPDTAMREAVAFIERQASA